MNRVCSFKAWRVNGIAKILKKGKVATRISLSKSNELKKLHRLPRQSFQGRVLGDPYRSGRDNIVAEIGFKILFSKGLTRTRDLWPLRKEYV